jgi:mono/diheme cytochrome c family protein
MNKRLLPMTLLAICLLPACRQKMAVQPSLRPDDASSHFSDGQANRPKVPGTIARGQLRTDQYFFAGKQPGRSENWGLSLLSLGAERFNWLALYAAAQSSERFVDSFPFPITKELIEHGRDRFMIYCVVCHDPAGTGRGPIVQRGYTPPPSYHIERLRAAPVGHFFDVITNGYGSMPDYKQQVPPRDRWAIIAYIRALQLSRHFPEKELTEQMRKEWQVQETGSKEGAPRE